MGQSGCGKTTLLRIIMGAYLPSGGTARVLGELTGKLDREGLYRMRRKMGMLFQFGALFTDMSVYENVAFPLREHAELPDDLLRDLVLLKLQAVGLRGAARLMPTELSGGMPRRVALARSSLPPPDMQIVDALRQRLERLGAGVTSHVWRLGFASRFLAYLVVHSGTALRRFRLTIAEIYFAGVLSLIIILVSGLFVGMVLALQGYDTLQRFGASESLGVLVALSLVRELGPVVAGLLFASRAGSAITAEIGLIKATEQLSAMEMMAVDPVARVVAPRFWGGVISMPLLAALFSTLGIYGGYLVGVKLIGIDPGAFWGQMQAAVDWRRDVVNGVIKSLVFGVAVSLIAVFEGYDSKPTAEGVSSATTRTVVTSALAILALDFVLTVFMFRGVGG